MALGTMQGSCIGLSATVNILNIVLPATVTYETSGHRAVKGTHWADMVQGKLLKAAQHTGHAFMTPPTRVCSGTMHVKYSQRPSQKHNDDQKNLKIVRAVRLELTTLGSPIGWTAHVFVRHIKYETHALANCAMPARGNML